MAVGRRTYRHAPGGAAGERPNTFHRPDEGTASRARRRPLAAVRAPLIPPTREQVFAVTNDIVVTGRDAGGVAPDRAASLLKPGAYRDVLQTGRLLDFAAIAACLPTVGMIGRRPWPPPGSMR